MTKIAENLWTRSLSRRFQLSHLSNFARLSERERASFCIQNHTRSVFPNVGVHFNRLYLVVHSDFFSAIKCNWIIECFRIVEMFRKSKVTCSCELVSDWCVCGHVTLHISPSFPCFHAHYFVVSLLSWECLYHFGDN